MKRKRLLENMKLNFVRKLKLFGLCIVIVIIPPQVIYAVETTKGQLVELLKNVRMYQQGVAPIAFDAESVVFFSNDARTLPNEPSVKYLSQFRKNGKLLDTVTSRYDRDMISEKLVLAYEYRSIWNGKRGFHRQQSREKNSKQRLRASVSDTKKTSKVLLSNQHTGAFLGGRFWHNMEQDWITLLQKEKDVSLSNRKELVGEYLCQVISAQTPHGDYKLWVDSDQGYYIRRAEITVDEDDLAWGEPLSQRSIGHPPKTYSKIEMEIKDIAIQEIDGYFIPIKGTFVSKVFYTDGTVEHVKKQVERTNIQWNPDFDAMGAFMMDIPDGTRVQYDEFPGIKYEWLNGKLISVVDELVIEELDKVTEQLMAEGTSAMLSSVSNTNTMKPPDPCDEIEETITENTKLSNIKKTEALSKNTPFGLYFLISACVLILTVGIWLHIMHRRRMRSDAKI
ncbi:MAG: hypothetical protein ACYS9Y_13340 [Planctomycetota bacterium]|jgi:hypothetical protein